MDSSLRVLRSPDGLAVELDVVRSDGCAGLSETAVPSRELSRHLPRGHQDKSGFLNA
jgi:hypothetical protein